MIIDTHCHYNLEPLAADWQQHWQAAQDKGVAASIIVGTSVKTSQLALDQTRTDSRLWTAVGIHPNHWQRLNQPVTQSLIAEEVNGIEAIITGASDDTAIISNPSQLPKIIAIGETGLDYFRQDKNTTAFEQLKANQQYSFKMQLGLASKYQLPIILHVRDELTENSTNGNAYWDTYTLVKSHLLHFGQSLKLILHCVSGPIEYVQAMVELGAYVGVAGNVTYSSADQIRSLVKSVPTDKLLLETDAPFLPPRSYRGQICQPWMIAETATYLGELLAIDQKQFINNTIRLFPQLATTQS